MGNSVNAYYFSKALVERNRNMKQELPVLNPKDNKPVKHKDIKMNQTLVCSNILNGK